MHDYDRTTLGENEFGLELEQQEAFENEAPLEEAETMELAAELLSVADEAELNQFLGSFAKKIWRGTKAFVASPVGQALISQLKPLAKKALPLAGAAIGSYIAPGVGGQVGRQFGTALGTAFGLELEGLSGEDREFEVAKRFVNFAGAAIRNASKAPPGATPQLAAKAALVEAARTYAPGLVPVLNGGARTAGNGTTVIINPSEPQGQAKQSGRWYRRGNKIILVGV